jgi:hypothetical protein
MQYSGGIQGLFQLMHIEEPFACAALPPVSVIVLVYYFHIKGRYAPGTM